MKRLLAFAAYLLGLASVSHAAAIGTIQLRNTLQPGSTFYTSSGTVKTFNVNTSLRWPDGTVQTTGSSGGGSGIVSPGTFTWTNTFGMSVSTLTINNPGIGSAIKIMGNSADGSSDTGGVLQQLSHNSSGNRQIMWADSEAPIDTDHGAFRMYFIGSLAALDAITTSGSASLLRLGNSQGVALAGNITMSTADTEYAIIGGGGLPLNPPAKMTFFSQLYNTPAMSVVANTTGTGGQTAPLADFYNASGVQVSSFSPTGNLYVPAASMTDIYISTPIGSGTTLYRCSGGTAANLIMYGSSGAEQTICTGGGGSVVSIHINVP